MDMNSFRNKASELSARAGGLFSNARDRVSAHDDDGYGSRYSDRGYDDYGYDDAEYDSYDGYDNNSYGDYDYGYDDNRSSGDGSNGVRYPSLVSIEEVRATTKASEAARREANFASSSSSTSSSRRRSSIGRVSVSYEDEPEPEPAPAANVGAYVPSYSAADSTSGSRSKGYDSLFTPTASSSASTTASTSESKSYANVASIASKLSQPRAMKVISPTAYGDVASAAAALKAGGVVILRLTATPKDLSKRVMDFSFGVASALDAQVDCIADKVFVICKGNGLSDEERTSLKNMGVI